MKSKKSAATFLVTPVIALLAAGCVNMLGPEPAGEAAFSGAKTGAFTLYINDGTPGGGNGSARTLYPGAPEWSRFVISFTAKSGQAGRDPETAGYPAENAIYIDGLEAGTWDIAVAAYSYIDVNMNGDLPNTGDDGGDWPLEEPDYEAQTAYGIAEDLVIDAGNTSAVITLYSHNDTGSAAQGYFALNVDLSGLSRQNGMTGSVQVWPYSNTADYSSPAWTQPLNIGCLNTETTALAADDSTGASYYYMELVVQNNYQRIGRAEIVKIARNLTTTMSLTLTDDDFVALKPLTGTITTPTGGSFSGGTYSGDLHTDFPEINNFYLLILSPGGTIMSQHQCAYNNDSDRTATLESAVPAAYAGTYKLLVRGDDGSGSRRYFPVSPPAYNFSGSPVDLCTPTIAELSAAISGEAVTIGGSVGTEISPTEIVITVNTDVNTFAPGTPAYDWIPNLPAGISAVTRPANEREFKLLLTGTPAGAITAPLAIILPTDAITNVPIQIPVTVRPDVTFNITPNDDIND